MLDGTRFMTTNSRTGDTSLAFNVLGSWGYEAGSGKAVGLGAGGYSYGHPGRLGESTALDARPSRYWWSVTG